MKHVYLVKETSRGGNYGIGTYIKQLTFALQGEEMELHVIQLNSMNHSEFKEEYIDGIQYLFVPSIQFGPFEDFGKMQRRYCQNVFYVLLPYFNKHDELIFHFNYINSEEMVQLIKANIKCKIVQTIHFMNWSFDLLGNTIKLQKALANSETPEDERIKKSVEDEKHFIDHCDKVIAIAKHSFNTLKNIYGVPEDKLTLISNGLEDQYISLSDEEHILLRMHYGLSLQEIVLIFAGRLDQVKGGGILLDAFKNLLTKNKNIRLIIAGEGDFNSLFDKASPSWTNVTFTGFISKDELYKLYSVADIGVVPSLHEEFGYVALEMMMMKLPLVVSHTTGLSEMVIDDVNGLTANLYSSDDKKDISTKMLESQLLTLINDVDLRQRYGTSGRKRFLDKYEIKYFSKKMVDFYQEL